MAKATSGQRIQSKTTLVQAVQLIGSDKIQKTFGKTKRWIFVPDPKAQQILLKVVGPDATMGWRVLHSLDNMNMYGTQIPIAFNEFCIGERDLFIKYVTESNTRMVAWVDKQRQKLNEVKENG